MTKKAFLVVVNRKYIVRVEAQTSGGAEHVILDNEYLRRVVPSAIAFDPSTEVGYYKWAFETCETISLAELEQKGKNALATKLEVHNEMLNDVSLCEEEVRKLREELALAEETLQEAKKEVRAFECKYGIDECYADPRKIEELRNPKNN